MEKTSPWKLGGLTASQLGKRVWHEIQQDEVFTRSAALSYYFFSALIPMVFFLLAILGIFASQSELLRTSLLNYFGQVMPPAAFGLVEQTLREISRSSTGIKLIFGLVLSLWSGAGGVGSVIDALNRCYHIKESRPYWKRQLLSLSLTIAIATLTICALTMVLYGGEIAQFVTVLAWKGLQWPVALFFVLYALALIYYWGPDSKKDWQWITPGSLVGMVTWIAASLLFRVYLHFYNSYSKSYGSLGAVMVLLLWLYITGLAILAGGEINSEIENAARSGHPAKETGERAS